MLLSNYIHWSCEMSDLHIPNHNTTVLKLQMSSANKLKMSAMVCICQLVMGLPTLLMHG